MPLILGALEGGVREAPVPTCRSGAVLGLRDVVSAGKWSLSQPPTSLLGTGFRGG